MDIRFLQVDVAFIEQRVPEVAERVELPEATVLGLVVLGWKWTVKRGRSDELDPFIRGDRATAGRVLARMCQWHTVAGGRDPEVWVTALEAAGLVEVTTTAIGSLKYGGIRVKGVDRYNETQAELVRNRERVAAWRAAKKAAKLAEIAARDAQRRAALSAGTVPAQNGYVHPVEGEREGEGEGEVQPHLQSGGGGGDLFGSSPTARATPEPTSADRLFLAWNRDAAGLPKARYLGDSRRELAAARLKEEPHLAVWEQAIGILAASKFAHGHSNSKWVATFDWLLKPGSLDKVLNGSFSFGEDGGWKPAPVVSASRSKPAGPLQDELQARLEPLRADGHAYGVSQLLELEAVSRDDNGVLRVWFADRFFRMWCADHYGGWLKQLNIRWLHETADGSPQVDVASPPAAP